MVEVTCKFSKIKFEAATKRTQVHPAIATWKQEANKRGWYSRFFEAIEFGLSKGFDSVNQFEEVLQKASCDEPLETPPPAPHCLRDTLNFLLGESEREEGSFLKKLQAINSRHESGYSLVGQFLDLDSNLKLEDGIYFDCAATTKSSNDVRKGRKAYSYYTLFALEQGQALILLRFSGRRLDECPELKQAWQIAQNRGLIDQAVQAHHEEQQLEVLKRLATAKFSSSKSLGASSTVVEREGRSLYVLAVDSVSYYEDDDGVSHTSPPRDGYMLEHTEYTYYCREATDVEIVAKLDEKRQKAELSQALLRLKEIAFSDVRQFPRPQASVPQQGTHISYRDRKFSYDSPYLQIDQTNGLLWSIFYNGRDGDDWSYNNYGNYVASFQPLTPELASEVQACVSQVAKSFPEAVKEK